MPRPSSAGFTLIEVLAATLLTSIVLGVAVNLFIDLTRATTEATERTRKIRSAAAILDRVARDLEGSFLLVKEADVDPLDHPWLFLAESRTGLFPGAEHLKFVTRNHRSAGTGSHASGTGVVSYALDTEGFEGFALLRSSSARLPETLDRFIPTLEEDGATLVADGLREFSVRFMTDDGSWVEEWDSSQLEDSSALPVAADIRVSFAEPGADDFLETEPEVFSRRVVLPLRPLAIQLLLAEAEAFAAAAGGGVENAVGEGEGEEDEEEYKPPATDCDMTFSECMDIGKNADRARVHLGSEEAFQNCRVEVAKMPLCVEEYPAARLCGVAIECWYD